MQFVRCVKCRGIARAPVNKAVNVCPSCHTKDLERVKWAQELERVGREAREREERMSACEERRQQWLDRGRAASEIFSEDPDEYDCWE